MTALPHTRPLSLVEVEERIRAVMDALEEGTEGYDDLAKAAAEAEADYRQESAQATLAVIHHATEKYSASERDARITLMTADKYKSFLTKRATRDARREYLSTLRTQLDALRTLNASVRGQT